MLTDNSVVWNVGRGVAKEKALSFSLSGSCLWGVGLGRDQQWQRRGHSGLSILNFTVNLNSSLKDAIQS